MFSMYPRVPIPRFVKINSNRASSVFVNIVVILHPSTDVPIRFYFRNDYSELQTVIFNRFVYKRGFTLRT